jgi:uncharacterized repeat protein (TIGR01451 family)
MGFLAVLCWVPVAKAQISANEAASLAAMEAVIEGESIDISNMAIVLGQGRQAGTFSGGASAVGIDSGIYLSTGRGDNFNTDATVRSDVQNNGETPDADLTGISAAATRDTSAVTLQITPQKNTIFARFAFASEEYEEYVCSQFNDAFGLFISGGDLAGTQNIAVVPSSGSTIAINSVNNGLNGDGNVCAGEATNNSAFYNNNPSGPNFIFDGYTDVFEVIVNVTPGETYDFKMVVADAVDNVYDSAIFFEVFDSRWINDADLSLALTSSVSEPIVGQPFTITATVTNDGPDEVERVVVEDILPDGLTYVGVTQGGGYDDSADEWTLPATLAAGTSASVTLQVIAYDTNSYTTTAEIIEQWANDPDSTPANRATVPLEDDTATLNLGPEPEYTISGLLFVDNGAGGGTAYNGVQDGAEPTLNGVNVSLLLAADSSVQAVVQTDGNGVYTLPLDQSLAGQAVVIQTAPANNNYQITEAPGALPGLSNPANNDGQVVFTPAADTNYASINFGQLGRPTLTEDRLVTVEEGSSVVVAHKYTASGPASVDFVISNRVENPAGIFTTVFYHDTDCSEDISVGDVGVTGAINVVAGQEVCLLVRHIVAGAAPQGSMVTYDVDAATSFTGLSLTNDLKNSDQVVVTVRGSAQLLKQVCNVTSGGCDVVTGAGFAATNTGQPGDIIQYRIVFRAQGPDVVEDVEIFDDTPAYSFLKAGSVQVVQAPANMTCNVATPSGGGAEGYTGALNWTCNTGQMSPGDEGIVAFRVEIDAN